MTKAARILLVVSLVTIAFSLTKPGGELCYGLLKPAGALLFMVFFLVNLMAKEMALYDEENSMRHARAARKQDCDTKPTVSEPLLEPGEDGKNPSLLPSDKDSVQRDHAFAE